ncbi:hypothetical protein HaMNV_gp021 [Helicoverpa armigera multiple nucleopolyhedrovirus]|uniref:Orf21 n=1 Tax=Mamestra brassicae nuclear polyhedrosis virus TaxID=78219 RepID=A0A077CYZ1_NPVMB|nr:hypothetical protein HaMNV_gp021 [Helicoverpa armigera multiple nucleopolyhedrovirus]AIL25099.1 Orf21 [Mamestra brassicae multiple nucleopolyhedrovirus]
MNNLQTKLALYHYYYNWCCEEQLRQLDSNAYKLVHEYETLQRENYCDIYTLLDNRAALPHKWDTSKLVAELYVQTNEIHPDCNETLKAKLLTVIDQKVLEESAESFLKMCCKGIHNPYYEQYRLAKLYVTNDPIYGSCYYLFILGVYATSKTESKSDAQKFKKLAHEYLALDMDVQTFFYKTQAMNRDHFVRLENNAWNTVCEYINDRDESRFLHLPEFFRFVLKNIDHCEYFDFKTASSHQQRNKILCATLLGYYTELRHEIQYYLKK